MHHATVLITLNLAHKQMLYVSHDMLYVQGDHTVLISNICPYFEVVCLRKYYCPYF